MKKASEDKLIESWTPFHKRGKAQDVAVAASSSLSSPVKPDATKADPHKAVFNHFKIKLNASAAKWLTQRHEIGRYYYYYYYYYPSLLLS